MNDEVAKTRIQALLHAAPPCVNLNMGQLRAAILGSTSLPNVVEQADELAWGADQVARSWQIPSNVLVRHPMSGCDLNLPVKLSQLNNTQAIGILNDLKYGAKTFEDLFLKLWWNFPEVLGTDGIGPIGLLPVDPRLPAHSWRAHASLTSALAACLHDGDHPAFLVFTIASAQEFIGRARRTQDHWMGSFILSWLIWETLRVIAESHGPDCVLMPSLRGHPHAKEWIFADQRAPRRPTAGNLANIWTAIVPSRRAECIAAECARTAQERWQAAAGHVEETLNRAVRARWRDGALQGPWKNAWDRVKAGGAEVVGSGIYWAIVPWRTDGGSQDFVDAYQTLFHKRPASAQAPHPFNPVRLAFFEHVALAANAVTARKHLRDFSYSCNEGWRCTLCGLSQALTLEGPSRPPAGLWKGLSEYNEREGSGGTGQRSLKLVGRIRPNEQLCAACATKRLAWEWHFNRDHHLFPSTSTIAAAPFLSALVDLLPQEEGLRRMVGGLVGAVGKMTSKLGIDRPESPLPALKDFRNDASARGLLELGGDWLYPESYVWTKFEREERLKDRLSNKHLTEAQSLLDTALGKFRCLREEVTRLVRGGRLKVRRPSSYFAVLRMDGDKMGEWLGGKNALGLRDRVHKNLRGQVRGELTELPPSPAHLVSVAEALGTFTVAEVPRIVQESVAGQRSLGLLVFAGGDELLALAPVAQVFGMADALRVAFRCERAGDRLLMGSKSTVSGGIAVVHREAPLSDAIDLTMQLVELAKEEDIGGDAVVVAVQRGGEPQQGEFCWEADEASTLGVLQDLARALRCGEVATQFVPSLAQVLQSLAEGAAHAIPGVVRRTLARHGTEETLPGFETFAGALVTTMRARTDFQRGIDSLRRLCLIARFVAAEA